MSVERHRRSLRTVNSREIARAAGVSQSTVSRVINDQPGVKPETREHVLRTIRELGFIVDAAARTLLTGRSHLLGLIVSDITNAFYAEFTQAAARKALAQGYNVILGNTEERPDRQASYLELLMQHRVDGVIMASSVGGTADLIAPVVDAGFPLVLVNRVLESLPIDSVTTDNLAAGEQATLHLVDEHGHTAIAYVGGRADTTTNRDRLAGYREALGRRGIAVDEALISDGEFTRESGYARARELLARRPSVTAVVCGDDTIAFGCLDAAAAAGRRVPEDVAVVGFDDVEMASMRSLSLTSVRQATEEMGAAAVTMLAERIGSEQRPPARHVVLPAELLRRRSCGCPSPDDR
jgi:LacI family transcriptional regulator